MSVLTPLAVRIGGISWMPRLLPQIVWCDKNLHKVSRGRVTLLDLAGLPNLNLTVVGRRSGVPRTAPLLCVPDGDAWLIAGSYFGGPDMPVWVGNLRAAGRAEIEVDGRRVSVDAREVTGDERAERWRTMQRTWPNFAKYEQRTERTIPVFVLSPVAP